MPMRHRDSLSGISLDEYASSCGISCFGMRSGGQYQRNSGREVAVSRWMSMHHVVVATALAYDQAMSAEEIVRKKSEYFTG